MARTCRFAYGNRSGTAEWTFDGSYLVVSPESGSPFTLAVAEIRGIGGDGYTLALTVPDEPGAAAGGAAARAGAGADGALGPVAGSPRAQVLLTHLGADGPTLREELRRTWLVARAAILRLGGSGEGRAFSGQVSGLGDGTAGGATTGVGATGAAEPFQALLFEDVLVVASEDHDLEPVFLALCGSVEFDEPTCTIRVRQWPGQEVVFSKMAGQTEEFYQRLKANRAMLAQESGVALAASVPMLPAGPRGALAGMWLPGRLLELEAMDSICPGFDKALRQGWLKRLLRREEGEHLLGWASSASVWLGCTREGSGGAERPLWMLRGEEGVWFLEALSIEDRATYCFLGGEEMPALVSRLLCAPQFSREALYSPFEELTGESADLAVPARYLGFLMELRRRFRERVIHQAVEGWRKEVDRLAKRGSG